LQIDLASELVEIFYIMEYFYELSRLSYISQYGATWLMVCHFYLPE
jgi:hypothetical protein